MKTKPNNDAVDQKFTLEEVQTIIETVVDSLNSGRPRFKILNRCKAAEFYVEMGDEDCTAKSLANLASKGEGPRYRLLGKNAFYLADDLEEYVLNKPIYPGEPERRKR